jgi:broad specificity phosphatase PhoE
VIGKETDEIVLVRHGRSAHVHAGWMDRDGFLRWRAAYEAAGIVADDVPPAALQAIAANVAIVVTSETQRAIESARLLAPHARIVTSPLLHELELTPPRLGRIRLPLLGWALSFGVRMLVRAQPYVTAAEHERAAAAAAWLTSIADEQRRVVVVTHASFRSVLARALPPGGWIARERQGRSSHWSAWRFTRDRA